MEKLNCGGDKALNAAHKLANQWAREFGLEVVYRSSQTARAWFMVWAADQDCVYEVILRRLDRDWMYQAFLFKNKTLVRRVEVF